MEKNLLFVRIDDRLIHGQVMTSWMKIMPAKQIIVVDNKVAKDDFMLFVLQNAAPKGVKVIALTEDDAITKVKEGLKVPTFILAKTPLSLKPLVGAGLDINEINVGGMGMKQGREKLYKNISASEEERECFKYFDEKGIRVYIQIVATAAAIDVNGLLK